MAESPLNVLVRIASTQPSNGSMVHFNNTPLVQLVGMQKNSNQGRGRYLDPNALTETTNLFVTRRNNLIDFKNKVQLTFQDSRHITDDYIAYRGGLIECIKLGNECIEILKVLYRIYTNNSMAKYYYVLEDLANTIQGYINQDQATIKQIEDHIASLGINFPMEGGKKRKAKAKRKTRTKRKN